MQPCLKVEGNMIKQWTIFCDGKNKFMRIAHVLMINEGFVHCQTYDDKYRHYFNKNTAYGYFLSFELAKSESLRFGLFSQINKCVKKWYINGIEVAYDEDVQKWIFENNIEPDYTKWTEQDRILFRLRF